MKSGGQTVPSRAFMKTYTDARNALCREPRARIKTPRKSKCAKSLYVKMLGVWNKLTNTDLKKRFRMAAPFVVKKLDAMCKQYAAMKKGERRTSRAYLACSKTAVEGQTQLLKKMFKRWSWLQHNLRIKRDDGTIGNYTFVGALMYLSAPACTKTVQGSQFLGKERCNKVQVVNTHSLYPRCNWNVLGCFFEPPPH